MRTWEIRPVWEVVSFNTGTTNSNTPLAGAHTQVHWLLRLPPRAWETVLSMILVADVDADDVGDADNADDADDVDCEMSRYKNNYREVLQLSQLNKSFARTQNKRFLPGGGAARGAGGAGAGPAAGGAGAAGAPGGGPAA